MTIYYTKNSNGKGWKRLPFTSRQCYECGNIANKKTMGYWGRGCENEAIWLCKQTYDEVLKVETFYYINGDLNIFTNYFWLLQYHLYGKFPGRRLGGGRFKKCGGK